MNELEMKHMFEAALLAAGRPLTTQQLTELFDERERPSLEQVLNALNELQADYAGRGIQLLEVSSGWRIQVRDNCIEFVSRLWQERPARYSRALLETLALIAYRQPITRGEIEEIRGVAVSSTIMRTLHDRNWIRVVGHREVPGRPEVLATTKEFLDYFGLKSLDELPTLAELKDVETIGVQLDFATVDEKSETLEAGEGIAADVEATLAESVELVVETQLDEVSLTTAEQAADADVVADNESEVMAAAADEGEVDDTKVDELQNVEAEATETEAIETDSAEVSLDVATVAVAETEPER